jgi:hypothetical protein
MVRLPIAVAEQPLTAADLTGLETALAMAAWMPFGKTQFPLRRRITALMGIQTLLAL